MALHASSNTMYLGNKFNDGYTTQGGTGGTMSTAIRPRDPLDGARMGIGRTPDAEYADGYLGTTRNRRDDKLLGSSRSTERAYSRGVHAGERIPMSSYSWPSDWDPLRGIRNQARGVKTVPVGILVPERHLVNEGRADVQEYSQSTQMNTIDPRRANFLQKLAPPFK